MADPPKFLVQGTPWGQAGNPPRPNPPPGAVDGRTACLRALRAFLAELTFRRPGDRNPATGRPGAPIEFQIDPHDIHIGWPDNVEDLRFPSVVMLGSGEVTYDALGFSPYVEESTRDVYGPGTVIHAMTEAQEKLVLDVWGSEKPELRALRAGLEVTFMPSQDMSVLRLRVPDYFDELVAFTLESCEWIEEPDAANRRRHFRLTLDMRFDVVRLVTVEPIRVEATFAVDADPLTAGELVLDPNEPSDTRARIAGWRGIPPGSLPEDPCDPFHPEDD